MDNFHTTSIIISMILGLGVARLLGSLIAAFRARGRGRVDWLPLTWAFCIFATKLQFWWAINSIAREGGNWNFQQFVMLIGFTILLFVSAALLLPQNELDEKTSLRTFFQEEGRWSLLFLAIYFAMSLLIDVSYFGAPLLRPWAALNLLAMLLPLSVFLVRHRRIQSTLTLVAAPYYAAYVVAISTDRLSAYLV